MNVLNIGFGKAAGELHGGIWRGEGLHQFMYDTNPNRLDIGSKSDKVQAAFAAGQITVVSSLEELTEAPDILDVTTSSGQHLAALKEGLSVYAGLGEVPRTVLLEKPVVTTDEMAEFDELIASWGIEPIALVNENYLASSGLAALLQIGAKKTEAGINPKQVFVSFDKDRVPDVKAGRFTDPTLGAYGIEMPHMVSVANALAGMSPTDSLTMIRNEYSKGVHGIPESEATFVHAITPVGVDMRIAQGLGPFRMNRAGEMFPQELGKQIFRFAEVKYEDGSSARVTFSPAPDVPNYHAVVTQIDKEGDAVGDALVLPDNNLAQVIRYVIQTAKEGQRPAEAEMLSIATAEQTVLQLDALRKGATVVS